MTVQLPSARTRAETLVAYVEELIGSRGLAPGTRIATRDELRADTGLARATVNEAVRLLQDRGRVTVRPGPGGGLFVSPTEPQVRLGHALLDVQGEPVTVAEAIIVREALEPPLAADAARNRTHRDVTGLHDAVTRMRDAATDMPAFMRANWDLHRRIADATANRVLKATYLGLARFIEDQSRIVPAASTAEHRDHVAVRIDLHAALVRAIADGDAEESRRLAAEHGHHLDAEYD